MAHENTIIEIKNLIDFPGEVAIYNLNEKYIAHCINNEIVAYSGNINNIIEAIDSFESFSKRLCSIDTEVL